MRKDAPKLDSLTLRMRLAGVCAGLILNLLIVSVPLFFCGVWPDQLTLCCCFSAAIMFYTADLPRSVGVAGAERLGRPDKYQWAALSGSLLLLAIQWSSLLEACVRDSPLRTTYIILGMVLVAAGCGMRFVAVKTLAEKFRSSLDTREITTTGVYRSMRHPSETGLVLGCLGIVIALGAWRTAVVLVPLQFFSSVVRIKEEERSLLGQNEADYRHYQKQAGRFFPKIMWRCRSLYSN